MLLYALGWSLSQLTLAILFFFFLCNVTILSVINMIILFCIIILLLHKRHTYSDEDIPQAQFGFAPKGNVIWDMDKLWLYWQQRDLWALQNIEGTKICQDMAIKKEFDRNVCTIKMIYLKYSIWFGLNAAVVWRWFGFIQNQSVWRTFKKWTE